MVYTTVVSSSVESTDPVRAADRPHPKFQTTQVPGSAMSDAAAPAPVPSSLAAILAGLTAESYLVAGDAHVLTISAGASITGGDASAWILFLIG
jgi:hypothetical protein